MRNVGNTCVVCVCMWATQVCVCMWATQVCVTRCACGQHRRGVHVGNAGVVCMWATQVWCACGQQCLKEYVTDEYGGGAN